jgi:hypothetical protein
MRDGFLVIERDARGNSVPAQSRNTHGISDSLMAGLPLTGSENPASAEGNSMLIIIKFFTPFFRSGKITFLPQC